MVASPLKQKFYSFPSPLNNRRWDKDEMPPSQNSNSDSGPASFSGYSGSYSGGGVVIEC